MKIRLQIALIFPFMIFMHFVFIRKHGLRALYKSIYLNLKQFSFRDSLQLPIYITSNYQIKSVERSIRISPPIKTGIIRFGTYEIGAYSKKSDLGIIDLKSGSTLTFDGSALFGVGCRISLNPNGHLSFGNDFVATAATTFICSNRISFGHSCLISWEVLFMDTDLHALLPNSSKLEEIHIGNRNWIGCRCTILKSTQTGENCVIAANSQLSNKYLGKNVLISGSPAKIIRENIDWK